MKLKEIYSIGKKILNEYLGLDSSFETFLILNFCFNISRKDFIKKREENLDDFKVKRFLKLIDQRINGKPLQYIIGSWEFMNEKFFIKEGVLIPREDTEILVKNSLRVLKKNKHPKILELGSGSGIISIIIKKNIKNAEIDAVEISDEAILCMKKNIKYHNTDNVKIIKANILERPNFFSKYDIIVSNPPYVPTFHIKTLDKEVQNEPKIALDGGVDGLLFYKAIAKNWLHLLNKNGAIAVEIGINQSEDIEKIFQNKGFKTKTEKDFNNIKRVILAHL